MDEPQNPLEWILMEIGYSPDFEKNYDIITKPQSQLENPFEPAEHFLEKMRKLDIPARELKFSLAGEEVPYPVKIERAPYTGFRQIRDFPGFRIHKIPEAKDFAPFVEDNEEVVALWHDDPHDSRGTGYYYEVALLTPNGWKIKQGLAGSPQMKGFAENCLEFGPPLFFAIRKGPP